MKKPVGFAPKEDTAAVFVRVPASQAEVLDRLAFELKRPKRAIISALLSTLESEPPPVLGHAGIHAPPNVPEHADVLDVEQLALLLGVDTEAVLNLAEQGELPGRKLGGQWRFARSAVLDWLGGR